MNVKLWINHNTRAERPYFCSSQQEADADFDPGKEQVIEEEGTAEGGYISFKRDEDGNILYAIDCPPELLGRCINAVLEGEV